MTLREIKEFNNRPITDEEFDEIEKSDFVENVEELGTAPYFPQLTWYVFYLTDGSEVHVFL